MSVIREYGDVTFECDDCGVLLTTKMSDFYEAWQHAKDEGWTVERNPKKAWTHRCIECERMNRDDG
jgi:hypothetical protein